VADIHAAIAEVDPEKHKKTIEKYVLRGFGITLGGKGKKAVAQTPAMEATVPVAEFLERLAMGVCKYDTKRDAKDNSAL